MNRGAWLLPFLALLPSTARAGEETLDGVIAKAVRGRYRQLHQCYRRSLAEDRKRDGTVFIRVTLGRGDRVVRAKLERDELKHPGAVGCLVALLGRWVLPGARAAGAVAGSEVVIPLTFRAVPDQVSIWRRDVAARARGAAHGVRVQRLLHARNVGAKRLRLDAVTLEAGARLVLGGVASDRAFFVLEGGGRLESGSTAGALRRGTAAWLPPAHHGRITAGRRGLTLLELAVPARSKSGAGARIVSGGKRRRVGPLRVTPLLHKREATAGQGRFYLGLLDVPRPTGPSRRHSHLGAEVVYVISGAGRTTVGGRTVALGAGQALFLPPGSPHSFAVTRRLRAVQIYVPGGPEARFFE